MTSPLEPLSAFAIGLAGSLHCIGMCGGIVSALRLSSVENRVITLSAGYHLGRIASYTLAGALVGSLGMVVGQSGDFAAVILQSLSGVLLIMLGLYIAQWYRGLARLESAAKPLWDKLVPYSRRLVPIKHFHHALLYGAIWGWLPCGLVYSTLSWSLASADSASGALIMLSFGLGTLPAMITVSLFAKQMTEFARSTLARRFIGLFLILFGISYILSALRPWA